MIFILFSLFDTALLLSGGDKGVMIKGFSSS